MTRERERLKFARHMATRASALIQRARAAGPDEADELLREARDVLDLLAGVGEGAPPRRDLLDRWAAEREKGPDPEHWGREPA